MISPRLREQPQDVQDVFAVARAALSGYEVTGVMTPEVAEAILAALDLREDWDG